MQYIVQYSNIYIKPKDMHENDSHQRQENVISTRGNFYELSNRYMGLCYIIISLPFLGT